MFTQASGAEINAEDEEEGNKEKSNEEGCNTQLDITLTLHIKLTFKTPPDKNGLLNNIVVLHVRCTFWYISLSSSSAK